MSCYLTILAAQNFGAVTTHGIPRLVHAQNFGTIGLIARFTYARMALNKFQKASWHEAQYSPTKMGYLGLTCFSSSQVSPQGQCRSILIPSHWIEQRFQTLSE